jgi:DNA-binding transcriptional ArsR family regulator
MLSAIGELASAQVALFTLRTRVAQAALGRALDAARRAGIAALVAEVEAARSVLAVPAARLIASGTERPLLLAEVEALLASDDLVVDACRRSVRRKDAGVALAKRPVLFALIRALAEAWPDTAPRTELILRAFGTRRPNASHRARLRVEVGRLRRELQGFADVFASGAGFVLAARSARRAVVLAPPIDGEDAALLALLADGRAWSTSALALALGFSQRTVQRALRALEAGGKVRSHGQARARRWLALPIGGFTTTLLLPAARVLG